MSLIPESLRTAVNRRQTSVTGVLKQQQTSTRFRLDALVDACCEPLDELLAGKKYLLSEGKPSSLDCLATAHLSLMLNANPPQSWLRDRIQQRWGGLETYTTTLGEELWGGAKHTERLPWRDAPPQTFAMTSSLLESQALSGLPFFKNHTLHSNGPPAVDTTASPTEESPHTLPTVLLTATAVAAALTALATYLIIPPLSAAGDEKRNLSDMGEAGAMLSTMDIGPFAGSGNGSQPLKEGEEQGVRVPVGEELDVDV